MLLTIAKRRRIALWALALSLLLLGHTAFAQTKVPLLFGENKNEHGENVPLPERFTTMFSTIERDLSIQFQLQMYPWNRAVKIASTEGGLIFGLSITPDRAQIFSFSEPALYNNLWLVTRSNKRFPFNTLADLKDKVIGVVRGSRYGGEFDAQKNILFKTDDEIDAYGPRLRKLLGQGIDAMIFASPLNDAKEVEKMVNAIDIGDSGDAAKSRHRFSVLPVPVLKDGIRFASLKGQNEELIRKIDIVLIKLQNRTAKYSSAKSAKSKK